MKALKIFVAALLLSVCGLAGSQVYQIVEVINLSSGDQVNADKFTVVAKGSGFQAGDSITIKVQLINNTTGIVSTELLAVSAK